jgi:anti-sigma-K factor RskA
VLGVKFEDADDRSATAGEYVLGSLGAAERAAVEEAMKTDAALRAEVYAWQDRLFGLTKRSAPVEPAARGWDAIEAKLRPASAAPVPASQQVGAANDPLWQRLRRWQITGGLAIAASLLLASLLVLRGPGTAEPERYLAVLQAPGDQSTGWVVEVTAGRSVRLVPVSPKVGEPVPAGKSLQFWTKPEGAAGPTSLGLVRAGMVTELPVGVLPAVAPQTLFEVTLEPEGGSTIGRPTGPILYVGRSVRL